MNVLITHEKSGIMRRAFQRHGHNAFSCDLRLSDDGQDLHHIMMDAIFAIKTPSYAYANKWDLIIMHPVCTKLSVSGNHVYAKGKPKHNERLVAMEETERLWDAAIQHCDRVALENPIGVLARTKLGKPTQIIQPYQFGEDASKATCFWLHNLTRLEPTNLIEGRCVIWNNKPVKRWANQCNSGQNKLGPSITRADQRAQTYPGIANACASKWGNDINA